MSRLSTIGVGALLAVGVLFAFADAIEAMIAVWSTNRMYSYAFAVPFISLYLLWTRREDLRRRRFQPARLIAAPVLAVSVVMLVVGEAGAIRIVQQLGLILAVVGLVLFLFGVDILAASGPAIAYLLFMVPFWDVLTEPLHWPFQNSSAQLGVAAMRAVGVPAYREGVLIVLPNIQLEVARACSGINFLVSVIALALPLAYLRLLGLWRSVFLIVFATTIAMLANGLRVALIGTLAYHEVGSPLHGPGHVLNGLFVAIVGYVALFVGLRWLESRAPQLNRVALVPPAPSRWSWRPAEAGGLAAVFWTVALVGIGPAAAPVALAAPLDELPVRLERWSAEPYSSRSSAVPAVLWSDADDRLSRVYRSEGGQVVMVDVWYFSTQRERREAVSFGSAELQDTASHRRIALDGGGMLDVNAVSWVDRGEIGLFWYDIAGVPEFDPNTARLRSLWNSLANHRSDGAAVLLRGSLANGSADEVSAALETFAATLYPALARHWSSPL